MNARHLTMLLVAPAATMATAAHAAPFFAFELSGSVQGQFRIAAKRFSAPDEVAPNYFVIERLAGTIDGRAASIPSVTFNTLDWNGGLTAELRNGRFVGLFGDQLFTGTTAMPTLRTGTFALVTDIDTAPVTLTITQGIGEAVPEPATWALMILGFGATAGAMRRRAAVRATVRFA